MVESATSFIYPSVCFSGALAIGKNTVSRNIFSGSIGYLFFAFVGYIHFWFLYIVSSSVCPAHTSTAGIHTAGAPDIHSMGVVGSRHPLPLSSRPIYRCSLALTSIQWFSIWSSTVYPVSARSLGHSDLRHNPPGVVRSPVLVYQLHSLVLWFWGRRVEIHDGHCPASCLRNDWQTVRCYYVGSGGVHQAVTEIWPCNRPSLSGEPVVLAGSAYVGILVDEPNLQGC